MKAILSQRNIEKLSRIISTSNFEDLTAETLLAAFQEEGIGSLEDLAKRLTEALQEPIGVPQRVNYENLFSRPTPSDVLETIKHQVPKVPFILNGVEHDPEDIVRYNGQELCFIPQHQLDPPMLLVLAHKEVWGPFLRTLFLIKAASESLEGYQYGGLHWENIPGPIPPEPPPLPPPTTDGGSIGGVASLPPVPDLKLYTDEGLQGDELILESGESYRDFTHIGWWAFAGDWNDLITSIYPTTSLCMVFEHAGFQGSSLFVGPREGFHNLTDVGWNERISAAINSG
jgi:hypothetical protein